MQNLIIAFRERLGNIFLSPFLAVLLILALAGCGGEVTTDGLTDQPDAENSQNTATLSWVSNTETDLAGYMIYYGMESNNYPVVLDVGLTNTPDPPEYTVTDLALGKTYFFL